MSTTVSHQVPTAQQPAISDLTGYEDAATVGKRKARYPCGYVSSRSPFRTVREAFTSYGSTPSVILHGFVSMKRLFPFLQFHGTFSVFGLRLHWVPLVPSFRRLGTFAFSSHPGVRGFPTF